MEEKVINVLVVLSSCAAEEEKEVALTWGGASLCRFVGSLASLPLPDSSSARQHLLLFISALIPKALASLLTSFTLALAGDPQARRRALDEPRYLDGVLLEVQRLWPPFIGGRRIAEQVCRKEKILHFFCTQLLKSESLQIYIFYSIKYILVHCVALAQ